MDKIQTFEQFLATQNTSVDLMTFIFNMLLTILLSLALSALYLKFGTSLSNRREFSRIFITISCTTMLIITLVKSSLALSLGLVGALSIVRFRAAIKEPEELSYLFLAIAIGLGFGANQRAITIVAFSIIAGVTILSIPSRLNQRQAMALSIVSQGSERPDLEKLTDVLKKYCSSVRMKRFDETPDLFEGLFFVEFQNFAQLRRLKEALKGFDRQMTITFLDGAWEAAIR